MYYSMKSPNITIALLLSTLLLSCSDSEYAKLVKAEMATGIIHDSLLFNMKFGQSKEYFLQSCWRLNQKGIVGNGPGSRTVKYELPSVHEKPHPTDMTLLFFGTFNEEKEMTGMDFQFYYNAWSIWNETLQAEKLLPVVKDSLLKWYPGNDFIKVPLEKSGTHSWVKVDGNRRITIRPLDDDRLIKAKIDDLRYVFEKD